jgi:hypothetical protein
MATDRYLSNAQTTKLAAIFVHTKTSIKCLSNLSVGGGGGGGNIIHKPEAAVSQRIPNLLSSTFAVTS